jgi:hypothetical protein
MFDFFEDNSSGHAERILAAIEARKVHVVALLERPGFSRRDHDLEVALAERFPNAEHAGRFQVRWR